MIVRSHSVKLSGTTEKRVVRDDAYIDRLVDWSDESVMSASFEPPEGAANISVVVIASGDSVLQVTTWLELSPSERAQAMMQQARGGVIA